MEKRPEWSGRPGRATGIKLYWERGSGVGGYGLNSFAAAFAFSTAPSATVTQEPSH
jgi:hypothetical protein